MPITFKNPRDQLGLRNLLQQSFSTQFREVLDTFRKVTIERPFDYLLLDLHPASLDDQRILSHNLEDEGFMRCYRFCKNTYKDKLLTEYEHKHVCCKVKKTKAARWLSLRACFDEKTKKA